MSDQPPQNGSSSAPGVRRSGWTFAMHFFYLGLGVKRWLLVGAFGISVSSVGLAFVIKNLFDLSLPDVMPWYWEGVALGLAGVIVLLLSVYGLYRSIGPMLFPAPSLNSLTDAIYTRRSRARGPRIVVIGGGTGLSVLLRGLKEYTDNLTAIVTVADDGGSSGRLRKDMSVLPPGDFRNCLVAMSDAESLVQELFQYRFDQGNGLEGHSFGNLFIVAMTNVTGSFEKALYESSRVLAVHGQILPATVANLSLSARLTDGSVVQGESSITQLGGGIDRVFIDPAEAEAYPPAIETIKEAHLIVVGPGSLYTSILPNLLVSGIAEAIEGSRASKVYVCNVATQHGETDGYTVSDHVEALQKHTFPTVVDYVVANDSQTEWDPKFLGQPVELDAERLSHVRAVTDALMDEDHPVRHDPKKLGQVIMDLYHRKPRGIVGGRSPKAKGRRKQDLKAVEQDVKS